MPDGIVSAVNAVDGLNVLWINRYAGGGNLFLDLEAVEDLTTDPEKALDRVVDLLPMVFRADWAVRVHRLHGAGQHTDNAPLDLPFLDLEASAARIDIEGDDTNLYAGARIDGNELIVIARRGGPEFVDAELARLGHLVSLAASLARP
jgi:hypothetical protein